MEKRLGRVQTIAKYFNPLVLKFAGASRSPFAAICHTGRRSGKAYKTPIVVRPALEGFVIAMPYGLGVDWYRNMTAAGEATLLWHGKEYIIHKPVPMDSKSALPLFPVAPRLILSRLHIKHFVRVHVKAVRRPPRKAAS